MEYFIDVYLIDGTRHTIPEMMTLEAIQQFMSEAADAGSGAFSSTTGEISIVPMTSILRVALRERKQQHAERLAYLAIPPARLKSTREALCAAQAWMTPIESDRLAWLIEEIDRHRPLGPDGKHGNLHTATCGCKDVGGTS